MSVEEKIAEISAKLAELQAAHIAAILTQQETNKQILKTLTTLRELIMLQQKRKNETSPAKERRRRNRDEYND